MNTVYMFVYLDIIGRQGSVMFLYVLRAEELTSFVPGCLCKDACVVSKGWVCVHASSKDNASL